MHRFYVRLVVVSESLVPEQITQAVGIQPTSVWHKGDKRGGSKSRLVHKENGWELHSDLPVDAPLNDHLRRLIQQVQPCMSQFKAATEPFEVEVSCAIYLISPQMPELHLDQDIVQAIAEMRAEIDLDLYDFIEKDE